MIKVNLSEVVVVVADPDQHGLRLINETLTETGFEKIELGSSLQFLADRVTRCMPDIVISETELPDGDFCDFITDLRHHRYGRNPFLAVKALTTNPTPQLVNKVIMAGADDLLTKPTNPVKLMERVDRLIHQRKPFVVTSDYIGPVRPARSQKESNAKQFEAPNTVKARVEGIMSDADIFAMVDKAVRVVNIQRLEAHAEHIDELVKTVVPRLIGGQLDATTRLCLDRLIFVSEDAGRRLIGTRYDHVSDLSQALLGVATTLRNCGGAPLIKDIKLLEPLNRAIQLGFEKGADAHAARQISTEISA